MVKNLKRPKILKIMGRNILMKNKKSNNRNPQLLTEV